MATAEDLNADIEVLKQDFANLRSELKVVSDALRADARDALARTTESAASLAKSTLSTAANASSQGYSAAIRRIEANPLISILTAAGIGLVIGSMLRR